MNKKIDIHATIQAFSMKSWLSVLLILTMVLTTISLFPGVSSAASSATISFNQNVGSRSPNIFGGAINFLDGASDIDSLRSVGINFVRRDVYLSEVLPNTTVAQYLADMNVVGGVDDPNNWNWSKYGWIDTYKNKGLKTMIILSYNVPWLSYNNATNGVPKNWTVYEDIIKKITQRFQGKIEYIEVWNEPDLLQFLNVSGSGYANSLAAYKDIYKHAASAVRSVNATIPIGGPALSNGDTSWANAMLQDATIKPNVNFLSYHLYKQIPNGESAITDLKNVATANGVANMPVYVTEWNWDWQYIGSPMNDGSTDAIPYVGHRLHDMIYYNAAGTGYFAFNKNDSASDFYSIYANGSLTPKMNTYSLLSKRLGLGDGTFTLRGSSWSNGAASIVAGGATNSSGKNVAWVVNEAPNSDAMTVNLTQLSPNTNYKAELYLADSSNNGNTISQSTWIVQTLTTNSSGNGSLVFTLPPRSVVGIKLGAVTTGSTYQAHVGNVGWQSWVNNEATAGTVGQGLSMEALKIQLVGLPAGSHIKYQAHVSNVGWQSWVYDGVMAGTTGQANAMEAIKIMLEGAPAGYHVKYRAHVANVGWQSWVSDGAIAGTTGQALPIQAIEISVYQ
ncbi:GH39 family glycosyl hydrolase [Cohnella rhizosphaerae]|uniref:Cellulase family glycosylhydrolase n=1 Tax=Cohnella rhizosphaerae TaxID=1457232 RepID=A0A9X4KTQ5_9BACL|nr:cellulase family glycosylhydrolase [Cohnella rhizosphaerae]MDG0810620.1 cellulase family glycosylhydrolase [Cohnella rhizosphaerae]